MRHRMLLWMITGLLTAALLSGCGTPRDSRPDPAESDVSQSADAGESTPSVSDQTVPADVDESGIVFEAQALNGDAVSSDIFSDSRLTMVNVWATYCAPCLNEMPELGELAAEYDSAEFQLIGIVSDVLEDADAEQTELAASLIEQTGAAYPHLLLNESLYYALLTDVSAVPTTYFIDGDGRLIKTVVGARDKDAWKEIIDALLEE